MGEDEKKIRATVKCRCKLPNTVAENDQDDPRKDGVEENIGNVDQPGETGREDSDPASGHYEMLFLCGKDYRV